MREAAGSGDRRARVKRLPGAPWDEAYILGLLRGGWDAVVANGFQYTLVPEARVRTAEAARWLNGEGEGGE